MAPVSNRPLRILPYDERHRTSHSHNQATPYDLPTGRARPSDNHLAHHQWQADLDKATEAFYNRLVAYQIIVESDPEIDLQGQRAAIMAVKARRITTINLILCDLPCPPPELILFKNLSRLSLAHCPIRFMPKTFLPAFPHLKHLDLTATGISALPGLEKLTGLQTILLAWNNLREVPPLSRCYKLEYINLEHNRILAIPLESLKFLQQLIKLSLSHNPLGTIPCALQYLTSLQVLMLASTNLRSIPRSFFRPFRVLEELDLSDNQLEKAPSGVTRCALLKKLNLSNNKISRIADNIMRFFQTLDCFNCNGNPVQSAAVQQNLAGLSL